MDRRSVIKQMALTGGVVLSSGSILTLLQSCQSTSDSQAQRSRFFSTHEMKTISVIADEIIPKDDMPSASEVSVPQFIDLLFLEVFDKNTCDEFKLGLEAFSNEFTGKRGGRFDKASAVTQSEFITSLYNVSEQDKENIFALLKKHSVSAEFKNLHVLYKFLTSLRGLTIDAYFTSETVGEQYLAYDPIPGDFLADFPVEASTKVWSL